MLGPAGRLALAELVTAAVNASEIEIRVRPRANPRGGMRAAWKQTSVSDVLTGIGDGERYSFSDRDARPLPLVCVGSKMGTTSVSPDGRSWFSVSVYDSVTALQPQASPRIIDVFINNALYRRVRW